MTPENAGHGPARRSTRPVPRRRPPRPPAARQRRAVARSSRSANGSRWPARSARCQPLLRPAGASRPRTWSRIPPPQIRLGEPTRDPSERRLQLGLPGVDFRRHVRSGNDNQQLRTRVPTGASGAAVGPGAARSPSRAAPSCGGCMSRRTHVRAKVPRLGCGHHGAGRRETRGEAGKCGRRVRRARCGRCGRRTRDRSAATRCWPVSARAAWARSTCPAPGGTGRWR